MSGENPPGNSDPNELCNLLITDHASMVKSTTRPCIVSTTQNAKGIIEAVWFIYHSFEQRNIVLHLRSIKLFTITYEMLHNM